MSNTTLNASDYESFDACYYDVDEFYNRDREGDVYQFLRTKQNFTKILKNVIIKYKEKINKFIYIV